jgi:hypothetical protein
MNFLRRYFEHGKIRRAVDKFQSEYPSTNDRLPLLTITQKMVEEDPYCIWNSFVSLLAEYGYEELTQEQRPAHLVFWYESEVQNGGHLQYFVNRGVEFLDETIAALEMLGATRQQQILRDAGVLFMSRKRDPIRSVDNYVSLALEGEFNHFDQSFYECSPTLIQCLERHLQENQSHFVIVE